MSARPYAYSRLSNKSSAIIIYLSFLRRTMHVVAGIWIWMLGARLWRRHWAPRYEGPQIRGVRQHECGAQVRRHPPSLYRATRGPWGAGYGPGAGGAERGGRSLALNVSRLGAVTESCGRLFQSAMVRMTVPFHSGEFLSFPDNFRRFFEWVFRDLVLCMCKSKVSGVKSK